MARVGTLAGYCIDSVEWFNDSVMDANRCGRLCGLDGASLRKKNEKESE
jgi:hypothetical protein